jgi:heterodisulfide reductase subunit C
VTVRGGAVPWEQVPPAQVIRFVKHYAADPGLSKREAAQQNLAAAVYVFEAGGGSEAAQKMAAEFAGEATRASAAIEAQVKALLPELSGGK